MLAIRDRLMNKKRASKTDSLLDVDLLFYIYYLYTSTGFAPPKDSVKGSPVEDSSEYWEKHYKSDKEAERIMQYVVDNFDENYVKVAEARINLASLQYAQEKYALALKNYQLFEAIDTKKLYALPTMGRDGAEILVTKEKNLKDGLNSINYSMGFARVGIIRATVYSDRARAVKALDALSVKYKNDEKAMAEIKEQLDEIARRKAAEAEIEEFRKRINLQKMKK